MSSQNLDQVELINRTAKAINERGWRTPALVALEICRPLAFVGGSFLWVLQPVIGLLVSTELVGQAAHLLEEPETVDLLIRRLDTPNSYPANQ